MSIQWSDVGKAVAGVAPALGTMLGGPVGGAAGTLLASLFGTEEDPEKVMEAIKADPNAMVKIAELEAKEFGDKAKTLQTMLIANAQSKHTTRPKIAYQAWQVTGISILMLVFSFLYAVLTEQTEMVQTIINGWPFVLAAIGTPVALLRAYFGILAKEDNNKMNALNGNLNTGVLEGFLKKFK